MHATMNDVPISDVPRMTQEEAQRLTQQGGTVVCTGLPEGSGARPPMPPPCTALADLAPHAPGRLAEFGIGMRSYGIGPNFRGVKMIPPAIHLVTYGTGLEKVGVFLRFAPGEVHVLEWEPRTEMLVLSAATAAEAAAAAVRRGELDTSLGPSAG